MYFPYFLSYMGIGLLISLMVFLWALSSGQFRDQQRARYLPLHEDAETTEMVVKQSRFRRLEFYALFFLAIAGLGASAAVLVFALINRV